MTQTLAAVALVVLTVLGAQDQQPAARPAVPQAAAPMEFDKYHFVVLMRPDDAPRLEPQEAGRIQREHLGHLSRMAREGHLLVAGPFGEHFDPKWRGLCLYDGDLPRDRVRELAEADPAVQAGVLEVAIMNWYTEKGAITFPRAERPER